MWFSEDPQTRVITAKGESKPVNSLLARQDNVKTEAKAPVKPVQAEPQSV